MPETPHAMTYAPLPDATDAAFVYQCCGQWCRQAPQAVFHLWHEHGFTAEAAWAQIEEVRGALRPPAQRPGSNAAPYILQVQPLSPPQPQTLSSARHVPPLDIAAQKQALINESVARFRARIAQL